MDCPMFKELEQHATFDSAEQPVAQRLVHVRHRRYIRRHTVVAVPRDERHISVWFELWEGAETSEVDVQPAPHPGVLRQ